MAHPHEVYIGFWRDYSQSAVTGLILTLSNTDGALLISFLALFIAFVGSRSWILVTRFFHHLRAEDQYNDGLHYQSQVILCNAAAEVPLFVGFFRVGWSWRAKGGSVVRRVAGYMFVALIHFVFFTAAGLFSSRIALQSGTKASLLTPFNCGNINPRDSLNERLKSSGYKFHSALNYVDACYNRITGSSDCNGVAVQSVEFSTTYNTSCPFQPSWRCCFPLSPNECKQNPGPFEADTRGPFSEEFGAYDWPEASYDSHRSVTFDTGKVDIIEFGMNLPEDERFYYRRTTTCSPISFNTSEIQIGSLYDHDYVSFHIGYNLNSQRLPSQVNPESLSYILELDSSRILPDWLNVGYRTGAIQKIFYNGSSVWFPIHGFVRKDSDVGIAWISAGQILYSHPSHDPIFGATIPVNGKSGPYTQTYKAPALGCADQHQICDIKNPDDCSPLQRAEELYHASSRTLKLSRDQHTVLEHFIRLLLSPNDVLTTSFISILQAQSLLANNDLSLYSFYYSGSLRDNQWILETKRWFAASLAFLQQSVVEWASKDAAVLIRDTSELLKPETRKFCARQVAIIKGSHQLFSVLGLVTTLSIGALVIAYSFAIGLANRLCRLAFSRKRRESAKYLQSRHDELLQIHQMALKNSGRGHWAIGSFGIPVTEDVNETFPHPCKASMDQFSDIESWGIE